MEGAEFTTREEIERMQAERLPQMATRLSLHPEPRKFLQQATMADALELSAADVVESGREFVALSDEEKMALLRRNYEHVMDRNGRYFKAREEMN
jgi:hypothetical protein